MSKINRPALSLARLVSLITSCQFYRYIYINQFRYYSIIAPKNEGDQPSRKDRCRCWYHHQWFASLRCAKALGNLNFYLYFFSENWDMMNIFTADMGLKNSWNNPICKILILFYSIIWSILWWILKSLRIWDWKIMKLETNLSNRSISQYIGYISVYVYSV